MSGGKTWTASMLRGRGWTNELIRELLPEPRLVWTRDGRRVRTWKRSDVTAAESTLAFAEGRTVRAAPAPTPDRAAAASLRELVDGSFRREAWDGSPVSLLAGLFHKAVMARLGSASDAQSRSAAQIHSLLGEFLALEDDRAGTKAYPAMMGFIRSGNFIRQNMTDPWCARAVERYPAVLRAVSRRMLDALNVQENSASLTELLCAPDFPLGLLFRDGLSRVWSVWYVPRAIRTSLSLLVALNPKDEYPEARAMHRRFIVHLGGTNTGKTYAGLVRLMEAPTGVYLGPLRLLALEAQETLLDARIDCSLATGEEEDSRPGDTHVAATAEKLDLKRYFDVAVIDECQMISDPQRGYAWTRAILGVLSPEVHLCAAPEAEAILLRLIASCGDEVEVVRHERQVPLIPMRSTVSPDRIQPGDALITFSKVGVLSVAEELRSHGKEPAIIYGALPYSTRRRQMEGFLNGDMKYVVSTDAIGMGLNLPIRRIIFMETELRPDEIRQIAGRAGRFGMYNRGYVGATQNLAFIKAGLTAPVPPIEKAVVGFSDLVLQVDFDLLEVLTEWNKMPTVEPYVKLDISRYISLISKMRELGFTFPKELELRAANIPFDETAEGLRELFFELLRKVQQGVPIQMPGLGAEQPTLPELELYYKKLDLYFSFCRAFDLAVDEDRLYETREDVAEEINEILLTRLKSNIRFCAICGKSLGLYQKGRLCDECYRRTRKPAPVRRGRKK